MQTKNSLSHSFAHVLSLFGLLACLQRVPATSRFSPVPLPAESLPLHAAADAAATLLLGAPAAAAPPTPAATPPVEPAFVVGCAEEVGAAAPAVGVAAPAAAAAAMCGLLFTSQLARCRWRSNSILLRCIPDSLKVSFIIAINQTKKTPQRGCNERRVAVESILLLCARASRDVNCQNLTELFSTLSEGITTSRPTAAPAPIVAAETRAKKRAWERARVRRARPRASSVYIRERDKRNMHSGLVRQLDTLTIISWCNTSLIVFPTIFPQAARICLGNIWYSYKYPLPSYLLIDKTIVNDLSIAFLLCMYILSSSWY